jgi:hypothetical protein
MTRLVTVVAEMAQVGGTWPSCEGRSAVRLAAGLEHVKSDTRSWVSLRIIEQIGEARPVDVDITQYVA